LQHLKDHLELDLSAVRYMMKCYPEEKDEEQMRRSLGRYGLTGKQQVGGGFVQKAMLFTYYMVFTYL